MRDRRLGGGGGGGGEKRSPTGEEIVGEGGGKRRPPIGGLSCARDLTVYGGCGGGDGYDDAAACG